MSNAESKLPDSNLNAESVEILDESHNAQSEDASSDDETDEQTTISGDGAKSSGGKKKKKSRRKRIRQALTGGGDKIKIEGEGSDAKITGLSDEQLKELLAANPALAREVQALGPEKGKAMLNEMTISDMISGLVRSRLEYDPCRRSKLTHALTLDTDRQEQKRYGKPRILENTARTQLW